MDDEEFIVLPNASSIVSICRGSLDPQLRHDIRILAPMVEGASVETLQVEGLWIDTQGQLLPPDASSGQEEGSLSGDQLKSQSQLISPGRIKMLEILTDLPGSMSEKEKDHQIRPAHRILRELMSWQYLIGQMFDSDHFTIGMEGMCLIPDCIGGRGAPAGLADIFFQRLQS